MHPFNVATDTNTYKSLSYLHQPLFSSSTGFSGLVGFVLIRVLEGSRYLIKGSVVVREIASSDALGNQHGPGSDSYGPQK